MFILALMERPADARPFRPARIPNGTVSSCSNCHVNPGGGGTRTPFGAAVFTAIGGTSADVAFWSASLAAADSDGDGVTNGAELRDPDGDGVPLDAINVTNPGNRPPVFISSPVLSATMGISYSYQATATDAEANTISFSKIAGPSWLTVNAAGLAAGTPPDGTSGSATVTLRSVDAGTSTKGFSRQSTDQSFILATGSTFTGWQNLKFTLPAQAALATPSADPDKDGLSNLMEYALRTPPQAATPSNILSPMINAQGRLTLELIVRDDDPKLAGQLEASSSLPFSNITTVAPAVTDPVLGDGLKSWQFTDTTSIETVSTRFARVKVELLP